MSQVRWSGARVGKENHLPELSNSLPPQPPVLVETTWPRSDSSQMPPFSVWLFSTWRRRCGITWCLFQIHLLCRGVLSAPLPPGCSLLLQTQAVPQASLTWAPCARGRSFCIPLLPALRLSSGVARPLYSRAAGSICAHAQLSCAATTKEIMESKGKVSTK